MAWVRETSATTWFGSAHMTPRILALPKSTDWISPPFSGWMITRLVPPSWAI
jgi:hypothetical protein